MILALGKPFSGAERTTHRVDEGQRHRNAVAPEPVAVWSVVEVEDPRQVEWVELRDREEGFLKGKPEYPHKITCSVPRQEAA